MSETNNNETMIVLFKDIMEHNALNPRDEHPEVSGDDCYRINEAAGSMLTMLEDIEGLKFVCGQRDSVVGFEFKIEDWIRINKQVYDLTDWVCRSYDSVLKEGEDDAWDVLGLGGDDDVDYNGSYVEAAFEMVDQYLRVTNQRGEV